MPIYEYHCEQCDTTFSHFWRSIKAAEAGAPPQCPACGSQQTQRVVSQVAILGGLGGLTPAEQSAQNAEQERMASILPKDQIEKLRSGGKK